MRDLSQIKALKSNYQLAKFRNYQLAKLQIPIFDLSLFLVYILFLIYSNYLPNALLNQPRLYADDTCLLISSPNIKDLNAKSKTELQNCKIWMDLNKLSLNINKTYSLLINPTVHHSSSDAIVFFINDGIQHVNVIKYLGIEIVSQLNF